MYPVRRLVVAEVAEPYLETEPFRLVSKRTAKHMMPFKPSTRATDKTLGVILL